MPWSWASNFQLTSREAQAMLKQNKWLLMIYFVHHKARYLHPPKAG